MRIWKQRHSRSYRNLHTVIELTSLISRFHSVLYNSEAIEVQENADLDDSSNAVFLRPLAFDADVSIYIKAILNHNSLFCLIQMLRTIASYFGRLESFVPLEPLKKAPGLYANNCISFLMTESRLDDGDQSSDNENSLVERELYPAPHNAPRSPRMDNGCWEIKWDHRDDCVSALMVNDFCFY